MLDGETVCPFHEGLDRHVGANPFLPGFGSREHHEQAALVPNLNICIIHLRCSCNTRLEALGSTRGPHRDTCRGYLVSPERPAADCNVVMALKQAASAKPLPNPADMGGSRSFVRWCGSASPAWMPKEGRAGNYYIIMRLDPPAP